MLELLRQLPEELADALPPADTVTEADYRSLVTLLAESRRAIRTQEEQRYGDMVDYYTMWAHQIKTPIASMRLTLQNEDSDLVRSLSGDLMRVEQYVEMVLTYLRMEDMSGDLQFEKVSLDKILKQSVRKYSQMFILQKIRLDYRPVERIVLTDEKWLEFVTEQILSNALKYTKNGGEIRICLEEKRGRECLVIEDNGIGIQAEDLPRVFEKGFTGYNGRADKKSTGIGLYLCKKIMDKMGHKIWIDSEVGKGTRVYLELTRKEWNPE